MSVIGRLNCKNISANAKARLDAGNALKEVADKTNGTMDKVRTAVTMIVDNSSDQASDTLEKLSVINGDVKRIINDVKERTIRTNNSVQKIQDSKKAVELIKQMQAKNTVCIFIGCVVSFNGVLFFGQSNKYSLLLMHIKYYLYQVKKFNDRWRHI